MNNNKTFRATITCDWNNLVRYKFIAASSLEDATIEYRMRLIRGESVTDIREIRR